MGCLVRYGRALVFARTPDDLIRFLHGFELRFYRGLSVRSRPSVREGRPSDALRAVAALRPIK